MKKFLLTLFGFLAFSQLHAQSAGLRIAGSYRLLGNFLQTRNGFSYGAGSYWDVPFGQSRFGLTTGLSYSFVNPALDPANRFLDCGSVWEGSPIEVKSSYHVIELPGQLSFRLAGKAQRGGNLQLLAGTSFSYVMFRKDILTYQTGATINDIEKRVYNQEYLLSAMAGLEYRHPLSAAWIMALGAQYRTYGYLIPNEVRPFREAAVYMKFGRRY